MARRSRNTASHPFEHLPLGRWTIVGGAFVAGLLLFLLVWLRVRDQGAPGEASVQPVAMQAPVDPLPGPAPAGAATPLPAPDEQAQLLEQPVPEPVAPVADDPLPASIEEQLADAQGTPAAAAPSPVVQAPQRLPGQPAPNYPVAALRRGESGTVVVAVEVGVDGRPASISLAEQSGSRDLDRAALEAVARWRFEPARDGNGHAVPGRILVPFDFKPQ